MTGNLVQPMVSGSTALLLAIFALIGISALGGWVLDITHRMKKRAVHRAPLRDALPPLPSRAERRRLAKAEVKRQQGNLQLYSTIEEKRPRQAPPVKVNGGL